MSDKTNERDLLARIRTLLALERNYLAEERTQLAKFRTGLALFLIVPPLYIFSANLEINMPLFLLLFFYIFLVVNATWGIWIAFSSRSKLLKIRRRKKMVKYREKQIFDSSKVVRELFGDCIVFEKD